MELSQAQVNVIFETIITCQEYDYTPPLGHELRMVKNELEKSYESSQEANTELVKKYKGVYKGDKINFGTPKNYQAYLKARDEIQKRKGNYNIEIIPLSMIFDQEKLPGKFQFNLDPIIERKKFERKS